MILQGKGTSWQTSQNNLTVTFDNNVRAGAVVFVLVDHSNSSGQTITTVQDQFSNVYSLVTGSTNTDTNNNEEGQLFWFRYVSAPASAPQITATFSANVGDGVLIAVEDAYSLASGNPFEDVQVTILNAPGTGADGVTINLTTTIDNQLLLLFTVDTAALRALPQYNEGTNMATIVEVGGAASLVGAAHCFALSLAGTKAVTATASNNDRTMVWAISVKQAAGLQAQDNFNRADEDPIAGWTTLTGGGNLKVLTNRVGGTTGTDSIAYKNGSPSPSDDMWTETQYLDSASLDGGPQVRCTAGEAYGMNFNDTLLFSRWNGSYVSLSIGSGSKPAISTNDRVRLYCRGSSPTTLECYRNGLWRASTTDSNGPQTGGLGGGLFAFGQSNGPQDNFFTGNIGVSGGGGGSPSSDAQSLGRPNVLRPRPFAPGITR